MRRVPACDVDLLARIIRTVAEDAGLTPIDVRSQRRTADVVRARHIGIWLARRLTECSFPEIGCAFGGRDHTTALYAVRQVDGEMRRDGAFAARVLALAEAIGGTGSERVDARAAG